MEFYYQFYILINIFSTYFNSIFFQIHIDEKIEEGAQGYVIYLTPEKIKLKNMQDVNRVNTSVDKQ